MDTNEILQKLVNIQNDQHNSQVNLANLLEQQNNILLDTPSRRDLAKGTITICTIVLVAVVVSTFFTVESARETARVGHQNHQTVVTYCAVDPKQPECVLNGSDTTKATAILTNCRIFSVLVAATPVDKRTDLVTNKPCEALGFHGAN
jgi:hypothetical protein